MHTVRSFLDTGGGLNFVSITLIPQPWPPCIKRGSLPKLRTATEHPLYVESKILPNMRFESPYVRAWFSTVPDLADDLLLGTASIDHFTSKLFLFDGKVVL